MKKFLNKLIGVTGYQIKNNKYLYDPDKNLLKSIKYFNVKSVIDVGANKGQFALKLINSKFKGDIISFEPLKDEHSLLNKLSFKKKKLESCKKVCAWK